MSLTYDSLPVFIGGTLSGPNNNNYIPATQVDVTLNTSNNPKRKLGKTIGTGDQFGFQGALQADINLTSLVHSAYYTGYDFIKEANQADSFDILIGDNKYSLCYLTDLSVNIEPFRPVTVKAKFTSLQPDTGVQISGTGWNVGIGSVNPSIDGDGFAYGYTSTVTDGDAGNHEVLTDVQYSMTYNRRYERTPVTRLNNINPTEMLLDGIEEEMTINSSGLETLIDYEGELLNRSVAVSINNYEGKNGIGAGITTPLIDMIEFKRGSRIVTEDYSVAGGDSVTTRATIKQIKL